MMPRRKDPLSGIRIVFEGEEKTEPGVKPGDIDTEKSGEMLRMAMEEYEAMAKAVEADDEG